MGIARIKVVSEYIDIVQDALVASMLRVVHKVSKIEGILYILIQSKIPKTKIKKHNTK